jgi:hypothetical protein
MSGSRKTFNYTDDDNARTYAINLDESNGEANISGVRLTEVYDGVSGGRPCNIRLRFINTVNTANPIQRKRFIVGDAAVFGTIASGQTVTEGASGNIPGNTWRILSKVGQFEKLFTVVDTGLTDGDTP